MLTQGGTPPYSSSGQSLRWRFLFRAWRKADLRTQTKLTRSWRRWFHLSKTLTSLSLSSPSWRRSFSCEKFCLEMTSQPCTRSYPWSTTLTPSCMPRWGQPAKTQTRRTTAKPCLQSWTGGNQVLIVVFVINNCSEYKWLFLLLTSLPCLIICFVFSNFSEYLIVVSIISNCSKFLIVIFVFKYPENGS